MNPLAIMNMLAWEALDSRGRPTVGCRVELAGGGAGRVVVPSGASRGRHEAIELRDGGDRYGGFGVRQAVRNVTDVLGPALHGASVEQQEEVDVRLEEVDGQADLGRLGANAALAVSLAALLARADALRTPLWRMLDQDVGPPLIPMPMVNILSGGAHAGHAIDVQDFLAVPLAAASAAEALEIVARIRAACAGLLEEAGGNPALVADEGGFAARLASSERALAMLTEAIERAGLAPGTDAAIAVDVAASQLVDGDHLLLKAENRRLNRDEWLDRMVGWVGTYPVVSIEDVLGEDDWSGWRSATQRLQDVQLVGDDLFATHGHRLERGIRERAANSVLVKVNQAGTVSRAARVLRQARLAGFSTVVSARSGDTEDSWLTDLAVGWRAGQIKVGSLTRSERTAKWNRLLEIEASGPTVFAGRAVLVPSAPGAE